MDKPPFYDAIIDPAYAGPDGRVYQAGPSREFRMYRTFRAWSEDAECGRRTWVGPGVYRETVVTAPGELVDG